MRGKYCLQRAKRVIERKICLTHNGPNCEQRIPPVNVSSLARGVQFKSSSPSPRNDEEGGGSGNGMGKDNRISITSVYVNSFRKTKGRC